MALTVAARDYIAGVLTGAIAGPVFDNAHAEIGVGDSSTAFDSAQTDLQAATNKFRKPMDATYPTRAANLMTFQSTFGPNDANFAWQEWAVFNDPTAGTMLNRLVEYNGTKLQGQTWVFQVQVTINLG